MGRQAVIFSVILVALLPGGAAAQELDLTPTEEEVTAWQLTQTERYVSARESAEIVLRQNPDSIIGRTTMGMIQRYGEGNLPRSLYNLRLARRLLEARFTAAPSGPMAMEWHARILQESAYTCGEMERFEEELRLWDDFDRLYEPDQPGERIWPLMMLHRYDEARRWAARALSTGERWPRRQALNGLCALENEAGNRADSYRWCTMHAREIEGIPAYGGVYFCNAGEAARGMLRLDEAERDYLEAARREVEWYANPWMELASLYLRAGRLAPAAQAVREMHQYALKRPPHTQQQDQSERHRTVAALLIVAGRPEKALPLTERAVIYPDRRGGQSRSPEADLATNALLHRRALLDAAEVALERGASGGFWERWAARLEAGWLRARAFRASRQVVALMADEDLLRGLLEAEGHLSFGTPPWLAADLVQVVGPGPVEAALESARARVPPEVPALAAYLDAYAVEAAAARHDWDRVLSIADRTGQALPVGEALLKARVRLAQGRAHEARGELAEAVTIDLELLQTDPTLLRRAGLRLPLRISSAGDRLSRRTAALLARSPRLRRERSSPLQLRVRAEGGSTCQLCLVTGESTELGCAQATVDDGVGVEAAARQCADLLYDRLLAPQVDMSLLDPASLDGSTTACSIDELLGGP